MDRTVYLRISLGLYFEDHNFWRVKTQNVLLYIGHNIYIYIFIAFFDKSRLYIYYVLSCGNIFFNEDKQENRF